MLPTICALSLLGVAAAQTPANWYPSANKTLGIAYDEYVVTPGRVMSADNVTTQPDVYSLGGCSSAGNTDTSTYMLIMMDLNIPDSDVTTADEYDTLVHGLATNTTTRLHWWAGNYTLNATSKAYVNSSDNLAEYTSPRPRDTRWHNYVFYLFEQPEGYVAPAEALAGDYYSGMSGSRMNFSLTPIMEAVGLPLAATYLVANNESVTI